MSATRRQFFAALAGFAASVGLWKRKPQRAIGQSVYFVAHGGVWYVESSEGTWRKLPVCSFEPTPEMLRPAVEALADKIDADCVRLFQERYTR